MAGRNYSRKDSPALADLSLIWDSANSDWRLSTLSSIQTLFEAEDTIKEPVSQYSNPLTGFSLSVTDDTRDIHVILNPAGTLATGTIVLPATPRDKQLVIVTTSNEITALTIDGGSATVQGDPTTLAAGGFFTMKYDTTTTTWYRVG